tara:strand:- start:39606 stop:40118 length:513 start_codon:yes stop_codon:yes gene_type:complete
MNAEIGYKDKDTLVIDWGKDGTGFGQLIFKHKEGCKIEVDAECMDINHIIETILALKDETYLKWQALELIPDSVPFLVGLEMSNSFEDMATYLLSLDEVPNDIDTTIFPIIHGIIKGGGSVETIDLYDKYKKYLDENLNQIRGINMFEIDKETVFLSTFINNWINKKEDG